MLVSAAVGQHREPGTMSSRPYLKMPGRRFTLLEVDGAAGSVGRDHLYPHSRVSHRRTSPVPAAIVRQWVIAPRTGVASGGPLRHLQLSRLQSPYRRWGDAGTGGQIDRRHAEIENAIRDLKYGVRTEPHAVRPATRRSTESWLAVQAMAPAKAGPLDSPHRPG